MAADEQGGEDLIEHLVLADDDLPHLGEDAVADGMEPFDALLQLGCVLAKFRDRYHRQYFLPLSSFGCVLLGIFGSGMFDFQQQLLCRAVAGRGFERRQHALLRFVALARGV